MLNKPDKLSLRAPVCYNTAPYKLIETESRTAKRLVRTEITAAAAEGELQALKDMDSEFNIKMRYRFYATLDERTCAVCGELDLQDFDPADAKEGENKPPMHPNCRCVIQPVMDGETKEEIVRRGRDEAGKGKVMPAGMTYKDWKEEYGKGPKETRTITSETASTTWTSPSAVDNRTETAFSDRRLKVENIDDPIQKKYLASRVKDKDIQLYEEALYPEKVAEQVLSDEKIGPYRELIKRVDDPPEYSVGPSGGSKELTPEQLEKAVDEVTVPLLDGSDTAREVIDDYTRQPSQFNKPLQGETSLLGMRDIEKIDNMTNLISQSELKNGAVVYSGGDMRNIYALNLKPENVVKMNQFRSTSISQSEAHRFAQRGEIPGILKITVPPSKGVALPVGRLTSANRNEGEIILQRGLRLEYVRTETTYKGIPIIEFRVI